MPKSKHRKNHKEKSAARAKRRSNEMTELKRRFTRWAEQREKDLIEKESSEQEVDSSIMEDSTIY